MFDRLQELSKVVQAAGGRIDGRKKCQKIVFILQELGLLGNDIWSFYWNLYGVYSAELARDIELAKSFGLLHEREEEVHGYPTYIIEAPAPDPKHSIGRDEKEGLLEKAVRLLSAKEARVLEVLSSVIYFEKKGFQGETLNSALKAYKGHLESFFMEAFETYEKLKDLRFL